MSSNTLDNRKQPLVIKDLTGGVNLKIHPIYLQNNVSAGLQDIDHSTPGLLQTRKGYTAIAPSMDDTGILRGLSYYRADAGTRLLIVWGQDVTTASNGIYKWTGSGSFSFVGSAGGSFSSLADVFFVQYKDLVYLGQDVVGQTQVLVSTLAATPSEEGNVSTSANTVFPVTSAFTFWQGRIWTTRNQTAMVNPYATSIKPNYLWFSDPLTTTGPTVWDRTNNAIALGYGTGQKCVTIQPLRSNEMIIFLNGSIERIQPVDEDVFGLSNLGIPTGGLFRKDVVDPLIGCGARKTVQILGSDIFFMDQYGSVRSLQRTALDASQGTKSLPLSDPINDGSAGGSGISSINKSQLSKAAAVVFGNKYYISIPTGSSTSNDKTYIFDATLGTWTGPYNYGFSHFVVADVVTEGVWKLYAIKDAAPSKVYEIESGTSDNGTAIAYTETTKRYDFGDFDRQKIGKLLIVNVVSTDNVDMQAEASIDGGGFNSLGTFNLIGTSETLPQNLPFTLGGGGITKGKFHLEDLGRFNDIQFRFTMDTLDKTAKKLGHSVYATFETVQKED